MNRRLTGSDQLLIAINFYNRCAALIITKVCFMSLVSKYIYVALDRLLIYNLKLADC